MKKLLPIALLLIAATNLSAQDIQFVKKAADLDVIAGFFKHTSIGNKFYFASGNKLFVIDDNHGGIKLVKDFQSIQGGGIGKLKVLNNKLIFFAVDAAHGVELWTSDGTEAGTQMIKDIKPGPANGIPDYFDYDDEGLLPVLQNNAYFFADDGVHGIELWKTGGDAASTVMVKNINTDPGIGILDSSDIKDMAVYNGKVYFPAYTPANGGELWCSDGTENSTQMAVEINAGTEGSGTRAVFTFGGKLYFSAFERIPPIYALQKLYSYDGNIAQSILDSSNNVHSPDYVIIGNKLFFYADFGEHFGLYVTDGTKAGTVLLKENIQVSSNTSQLDGKIIHLAAAGGKATFLAYDNTTPSVWASDGTINGTQPIKAASSSNPIFYNTTFGNKSYFREYDSTTKTTEIWATDGTSSGTKKVLFANADYTTTSPVVINFTNRSTLMVHGTHMYFFNTYTNAEQLSLYKMSMWPSSVEQVAVPNEIQTHPNPANSEVTITGKNMHTVLIKNISGATVYQQAVNANSATINTSQWACGMYIATIEQKDGNVVHKKIIKQ